MNAPSTAAAIAEKIDQLPLAAIKPSGTHVQEVRRKRFTKEKLGELAANIKAVGGVLSPILVRPTKQAGDVKYELVFGERRWLASKIAVCSTIPANVRDLNDEQVLEAQLSENLEREDLHELEEAEGYEEFMKVKKINADQLAGIFGISRSQVYARTKLLALCPEGRAAFYDGRLDASRALLIARIGHHDTQRQALKDITDEREPMTYREAHRHILERFMLKLTSAPFDIKDAQLLAKAGDCVKCPKRTGNQADLFGDVKNADVCTDPKCFDDKRQAHFATARKKKEATGQKVIYGAEAKKLLPHWQHNDNGYIQGEYYKLDAREYIAGHHVAIADVLGKDYVPTLIQHPLTGKFIEIAPKSTVSSKAAAKSRERQQNRKTSSSNSGARSSASPAKPPEPDVELLVAQRAAEALIKKPIGLDRRALLYIADAESEAWDTVPDFLCTAFRQPTMGRLRLQNLSDKDLARFIVIGSVVHGLLDGYGGAEDLANDVCKRHKVDPKKLKVQILAELKAKKDEASKPKITASGKPTWSTPAPIRKAGKKGASNFMLPMQPSDQLAAITGAAPLVRTEVTKKVWSHIKRASLQDKKNRRFINIDEKLALIFGSGKKQISMFEMTKAVSKHLRIGRATKAKKTTKAATKK